MNLKRYTEGGETARRQCFFNTSFRANFSGFLSTRPKRGGGYGCSPSNHAGNLLLHPLTGKTGRIIPHRKIKYKREFVIIGGLGDWGIGGLEDWEIGGFFLGGGLNHPITNPPIHQCNHTIPNPPIHQCNHTITNPPILQWLTSSCRRFRV